VGEVDGPGRWTVLKCSDLVKMQVIISNVSFTLTASEAEMKQGAATVLLKGGKIQLNDGGLGGLVKAQETADKIKALEQDLNTLKQVFTAWIPAANDGGAALKTAAATWLAQLIMPLTKKGDIENVNVKH